MTRERTYTNTGNQWKREKHTEILFHAGLRRNMVWLCTVRAPRSIRVFFVNIHGICNCICIVCLFVVHYIYIYIYVCVCVGVYVCV